MNSWTIINDVHVGAIRSAGTTPATALGLREHITNSLEELLQDIHTNLLINGDLFDSANCPLNDLLATYELLSEWLECNRDYTLVLSTGNHDLNKNSTHLSSFQLLCPLLESRYGEQVVHVHSRGREIDEGIYVIPHVTNQDLLNLELTKVPAGTKYVFVHANYDNNFAAESDHSLNISKQQAVDLDVEHIVFGHEHQAGKDLKGKVIIVGNQISSSVSDCLGNDTKQVMRIREDGEYHMMVVLDVADEFQQQDWRDLQDTVKFIRVTGTATASEAAEVISAIAKFRSKASALVITNAVQIEGVNDHEELALTHEAITAFNVQEALLEHLTPEEGSKILKLLEKSK